jgi:hypothetical protein
VDEYVLATANRRDKTETLIILPFCYFALTPHRCSLIGLMLHFSGERFLSTLASPFNNRHSHRIRCKRLFDGAVRINAPF